MVPIHVCLIFAADTEAVFWGTFMEVILSLQFSTTIFNDMRMYEII